jgi:hypothetical protein
MNNKIAEPPLPAKIIQFFSSKQNLIDSGAFVVVDVVVVVSVVVGEIRNIFEVEVIAFLISF